MKITCQKTDLVSAISIVMRAVPNRTTIPGLECLLIEADKDIIKLTSNDLEFAINTVLDGDVLESGTILIEAKILNEIARKLPSDEILISTDDENQSVTIKCGNSKFNIAGRNSESFPEIPTIKKGVRFSMSQTHFRNAIQKTAFCISNDANNRMTMGEQLRVSGKELIATALDGHRVAIKHVPIDEIYDGDYSVVILGRILVEISKIITGGIEDKINICFSDKNAVFQFSGTLIVVRLMDGEYFDISKLFAAETKSVVYIYAPDFIDAASRSAVLLRESDKKPLVLSITDYKMNLSVASALGTANEDLEIEKKGDDARMGFNPRFLIDAVNAIDDDEIEMRITSMRSPVVFTKDGEDYAYVVLPVAI